MAGKRMFDNDFMASDEVAGLTADAFRLYIYANLRADDDGLIKGMKTLSRFVGVDYESVVSELESIGLVINLGDGVFAVTHWLINNTVRIDRYNKTVHQDKAQMLAGYSREGNRTFPLERKTYQLACKNANGYPSGIPNGYQMDTQYSVDKVSVDKISKDKERKGEFEGKGKPGKTAQPVENPLPHTPCPLCGAVGGVSEDSEGIGSCINCRKLISAEQLTRAKRKDGQ